jgi:EmrB/QacA subfamily drug resistance transporter
MERRNPSPEELYARKWPIFIVTMVGLFMALIDVTIVNISLPVLERELDASVNTVSWVLNAYNIMFAVLLISMGRLADQFGRKRFFIIGMTIFTIGSLLCALAPTIGALIGFRVLQAVGAGILAPLALAITALIFPPNQRGLGFALLAVVANIAAAIGPPLGGVLVEYASWHWIFAINVPIGIAGIAFAIRIMPETYDLNATRKVDWIGMTLIAGATFCLTYGLVEANDKGWGSTEIVSLFAGFVVLTIAFALSQRYGRYPMLTRALTRNKQFVGASLAFLFFAMAVMGTLFLAVIAFVNLWGYSEIKAAMAILPIPVMGLIVSPIVGRISDRVPPRLIAVPALAVMAAGLLLLAGLPAAPDYIKVLPALVLIGGAMGAAFPSLNVGAMGTVTGQEVGLGSGIVNMSRQLGFAIGVAVLVAVFTGAVKDKIPAARAQATAAAQKAGYDRRRQGEVVQRAFASANPNGGTHFAPRNDVERSAAAAAGGAARDAFSDAFRVAALAALLGLPFAALMRSPPSTYQEAADRASRPAPAAEPQLGTA